MIKSLLAQKSMTAEDARLAELFRLAQQRPVDPFRKRRVLVKLGRMQSRRPPRFWLRPALAVLLVVSGSAAAELGRRYVSHGAGWLAAPPAHVASPAAAAAQSSAPPRAPLSNCVSPQPSVDTPPAAVRPNVNPTVKRSAPARATEDPEQVISAIHALRTESNPSAAQGFLDAYLKAQPQGALYEDALALAIEAAGAQRDPHAADYARRYLARFPHGKYRDLALRAAEMR